MKVVGLLLVAALIVIPAATALQVAGNFRMAIVWSCAAGIFSVLGGLAVSYYMDIPSSGSIVLLEAIVFGAVWAAARFLRKSG